MKNLFFLFLFMASLNISCQQGSTQSSSSKDITAALYNSYDQYKETSLTERRIKHHQLQPLIQAFKNRPGYTVKTVGSSIEGRSLELISFGSGPTSIFLWSQMHGDEPTATQAIFDILNFFSSDDYKSEKEEILSKVTLHFLPMLNPDGAEIFTRRNTLGIDINRDALHLQSPEGRTLKRVRDSLDADFGFNLHDQSTYYNAERTEKPATISYLAPAYNYDKDINEVRANAMKIIVFMNTIIQKYAPGQVGRYNDDFEPRAFGDNIQKWGTSAILIESGGYYNDPEKQEIRKLNYVSILSAIYTIAKGSYKDIAITEYEKIPENDRKLFDLKIENLSYPLLGKTYKMDLGIHRNEIGIAGTNEFWYRSAISDQGDLSTYYGYDTFDASGYTVRAGKLYPTSLKNSSEFKKMDAIKLLKEGYAYVIVEAVEKSLLFSPIPLHVVGKDFKAPKNIRLNIGVNPTFFLEKNGVLTHAVINGFLIHLADEKGLFKNALILN